MGILVLLFYWTWRCDLHARHVIDMEKLDGIVLEAEPGRSTLNVLNYKYKYFPPRKYLSTSTFLFGEMYLSAFQVLSKCT